jgi:hypothetical protein
VKIFLVDVLMTGSGLGVNSNFFVDPGDEPSPTSDYFSLGSLGDHLVVGFFGGIFPAIEINLLGHVYRVTPDQMNEVKHKNP